MCLEVFLEENYRENIEKMPKKCSNCLKSSSFLQNEGFECIYRPKLNLWLLAAIVRLPLIAGGLIVAAGHPY